MTKIRDIQNRPRHERVYALDVIRGFLILGMVCDHILYDFVTYFGLPYRCFDNPVRYTIHVIGASLFIIMSGASSAVSRSNWARGFKLSAVAAGVTLVTWIFNPDEFIVFGILHLLAASILLYAILKPILNKMKPDTQFLVYSVLAAAAIVATGIDTAGAPGMWILGFPTRQFVSADYFPLLPWFFVFLLGTWAGPYIFGKKLPAGFYRMRCRWLEIVGKNSLLVYLFHQPVLLGIFMIVADILSKR